MDNKELSDSDLCTSAVIHLDTVAIIGTLHKVHGYIWRLLRYRAVCSVGLKVLGLVNTLSSVCSV